jgi:S-adenosylmethionine-diacylglycerol 3-amino-3-carboxypropyl transferase
MKKKLNSLNDRFFQKVHGNRLKYNACWEDPAIDRKLLALTPQSRIVMITSAGCNALDYLLDGPAQIHAVDTNPRQNALLELKMSLIRRGNHQDFFEMFGKGAHQDYKGVYNSVRKKLAGDAELYWDKKIKYFKPDNSIRRSFYYHGTSGWVAWFFRMYVFYIKRKAGRFVHDLLAAETIEQQREIYQQIDDSIWDGFNRWVVRQPALMSLVGVPRPQIQLIDETYPGGLGCYIRDKLTLQRYLMFFQIISQAPFAMRQIRTMVSMQNPENLIK